MIRITSSYSIERQAKEHMPNEAIFTELTYGLGKQMAKLGKLPIPTSKDNLLTYKLSIGALSLEEYYRRVKESRELAEYKKLAPHLQTLVDRALQEEDINTLLGH